MVSRFSIFFMKVLGAYRVLSGEARVWGAQKLEESDFAVMMFVALRLL
jgi:hypothetical protein